MTVQDIHIHNPAPLGRPRLVEGQPSIQQALAAVMTDVQAVGKDGQNTSQNYAFRGIDGVMNAVGPALRTHGVVIIPTVIDSNYRDVEVGKNRTLMREVTVTVRYTAWGPAGDSISGVVCGESMDSGDKGTAKAFSVAYRTFLLQALTIPTHQPDPDEQSYERSAADESEPQHPDAVALLVELEDLAEVGDKLRTQLVERAGAASAAAALQDEGWRNWLRQAIDHHRKTLGDDFTPALPLGDET